MSDVKERLQALIDDEYFTQEELEGLGFKLGSNDKAEEAKEPEQETKTAEPEEAKEEPKEEEKTEVEAKVEPQQTEPQATTEKVETENVEETASVEPTEPVVDYKAKYEEEVKARDGLIARIDAMEAKLKGMVNAEPDIPLGVSTTPQPEAGATTEDFQEKFMREHSTNILNH